MCKHGNVFSLLVLIAREAWSYNAQALLRAYTRQCSIAYRLFSGLPGGHSEWEPPDPIPNSEVKPLSADGSAGSPRARVGHRQALNKKAPSCCSGLFLCVPSFDLRRQAAAVQERPPVRTWRPCRQSGRFPWLYQRGRDVDRAPQPRGCPCSNVAKAYPLHPMQSSATFAGQHLQLQRDRLAAALR